MTDDLPRDALANPLAWPHQITATTETEHVTWRIALAARGHEFRDKAELETFIEAGADTFGKALPADTTDEDRAQDLAYHAMEAERPWDREDLTAEALSVDPDNVDARTIEALTFDEVDMRIQRLEDAVAVGERRMPPAEVLEDFKGPIWKLIPIRPAQRARASLAAQLVAAGRLEEASAHYTDVLALDEADNLRLRYPLFSLRLETDRLAEARELLRAWAGDRSAILGWGAVLLEVLEGGGADEALEAAREVNPHVEALLLRPERIPADLPDTYACGSPGEAAIAADLLWRAWNRQAAALDWLRERATHRRLRHAPERPLLDRMLDADHDGRPTRLLPLLDPADAAVGERLRAKVRQGGSMGLRLDFATAGAAWLLGRLGHPSAVPDLVAYLQRMGHYDGSECTAVEALGRLGAPAADAALRVLPGERDLATRGAFFHVILRTGARSDEAFAALCEECEAALGRVAGMLAAYGDPRGVTTLERLLDGVASVRTPTGSHDATVLGEAIETLGGPLTGERREKFEQARTWWEESAVAPAPPSDPPPVTPIARAERPGRNEPCWCGSGRKYKKCHLAEDDAAGE